MAVVAGFSASATSADATEGSCRAIAVTDEPSSLLITEPVAPDKVSETKAPSLLILTKPAGGFCHRNSLGLSDGSSRPPESIKWKQTSSAQSMASFMVIGDLPWFRSFLEHDHIPHKIMYLSRSLQILSSSTFVIQVVGWRSGIFMSVPARIVVHMCIWAKHDMLFLVEHHKSCMCSEAQHVGDEGWT
jgi:hypothetical protein